MPHRRPRAKTRGSVGDGLAVEADPRVKPGDDGRKRETVVASALKPRHHGTAGHHGEEAGDPQHH
jgi:hypothetical protein